MSSSRHSLRLNPNNSRGGGVSRRHSVCMSDLPSGYGYQYPQTLPQFPMYPNSPLAPPPQYQQNPPRNKMDISFLLNSDPQQYQKIGDFGICQKPPKQKPKKEKIYPCNLCHMSFSTRNSRKKHILSVHEKKRPYPCTYPGCTSTFAERGNMLKHVRAVHKKQKNAKCDICGAQFAFNDGLLRHKRMTHGNERPYVCLKCNFGFKQKSHLRVHAMRCQNKSKISQESNSQRAQAAANRISRFPKKRY